MFIDKKISNTKIYWNVSKQNSNLLDAKNFYKNMKDAEKYVNKLYLSDLTDNEQYKKMR